jgi:hypothetical protein
VHRLQWCYGWCWPFWSVNCTLQYDKKENEEVLPKDIPPLVRSYDFQLICDIQKTWWQVHSFTISHAHCTLIVSEVWRSNSLGGPASKSHMDFTSRSIWKIHREAFSWCEPSNRYKETCQQMMCTVCGQERMERHKIQV